MSLKRHAAKRDANEAAIVEALEQCGASVVRLSEKGCPDLLAGVIGSDGFQTRRMVLLEVKSHKGQLTYDQQVWRARWRGPAPITVRSVTEALAAIGICGKPLDSSTRTGAE